ncbi:MAG: hypothetical protein A2066_21295 [Bacteroidetes bacterium GWB2_41_8]|nr:MAG: hypothetical protein A2066_21295 [Bacteroidetes bacterium GWB2_41_8]
MNNQTSSIGIACSIFKNEIEFLIEKGKLNTHFIYVDSELHMEPQKLNQVLEKLIRPDCLFCYGDCHSRMIQQENSGLIERVNGLNCVEIFLGKETYRELRREGAFFLLPEWTLKWERIFKELLGFHSQELAAQFMNEMHKKLIYVNTGVHEIPVKTLDDISKYFSMPVDVIEIDLIHLENAIKNGLKHLHNEG